MRVLVTGASGNVGQVVCRLLHQEGYDLRRADVAPPPNDDRHLRGTDDRF
jgi:uncharacterized protein YbjT (DUF2867 family)